MRRYRLFLSVSLRDPSTMTMVPDLHNGPCLVPFGWMVTGLVLNPDHVTDMKRLELM